MHPKLTIALANEAQRDRDGAAASPAAVAGTRESRPGLSRAEWVRAAPGRGISLRPRLS